MLKSDGPIPSSCLSLAPLVWICSIYKLKNTHQYWALFDHPNSSGSFCFDTGSVDPKERPFNRNTIADRPAPSDPILLRSVGGQEGRPWYNIHFCCVRFLDLKLALPKPPALARSFSIPTLSSWTCTTPSGSDNEPSSFAGIELMRLSIRSLLSNVGDPGSARSSFRSRTILSTTIHFTFHTIFPPSSRSEKNQGQGR